MIRKIREKININAAKSPKKAVLVSIMLFNVLFMTTAAAIIAMLSKHISGIAECGFWEALYRTITMVLDAGCIDNVITDVGKAGAFAAILCIVVVVLGMIFFTGAVIGYVTNIISDYIDNKNNGKFKLLISDHIVIINWNSRAAEIINDYLYEKKKIMVVVFVPDNRDEVEEEIRNLLDTTLQQQPELKDNITYIVREGDVAAASDLDDISISKARSVIILSNDNSEKTHVIKTLIQVSEISKANTNQKILVEVGDEWTEDLVERIIEFNSDKRNETIIPILYNELLGRTYSEIAVRSNKGVNSKDRCILVFGHNSKMESLIEWLTSHDEELNIIMIDNEESLASHDYYKAYPNVGTIAADVYDDEAIYEGAYKYAANGAEYGTALILSDDTAPDEYIDANALVYLIYIQENIKRRLNTDPDFTRDKLEVIVELLNPKNEEIAYNYGADSVIISNRYVSQLISQMSISQFTPREQ